MTPNGYVRALTPFGFDMQPDTKLHQVYYLISERTGTEVWASTRYQTEFHRYTIYLARKAQRQPWEVRKRLQTDLENLRAAILADAEANNYNVDEAPELELGSTPASGNRDYQVGRLRVTLSFDRALY